MPHRTIAAFLIATSVVFWACGSHSPTEPTPSCTATLSPATATYGAEGGAGSVALSIGAGCTWTTTSNSGWVTVSAGGSGSGPGTIGYAVAANGGVEARTGALAIAGQSHAVTQQGRPAAACSYELSPATARINKDAATASFSVTAAAGCAWTASSNTPWVTITAGTSGSGTGEVFYAAARNLDVTDRTAVITVANQPFTLTQAGDTGGCQYSVVPVTVDACMPAGTFSAVVTTQPNCTWTADADMPWLTVRNGASGNGSGTITIAYTDNYDAPRSGVVRVRWPTPTEGQNVHFAQAGCRYAVTKTAVAFGADGGTGSFDVLQQSDPTTCGGATQDRCIWTAAASDPWITITGSMPRSGDNPVAFVVASNPSASPRVGTISVRDKTVLVTQAGR